jgi:tetratricopeptide (TPR) repeat protein
MSADRVSSGALGNPEHPTQTNRKPALRGTCAPPEHPLPAVIGRYRIVRLLGEGGMGTVYEAEQDSPRRNVALKVLKGGLGSPELLWRFEHESRALGRLQHPGIAQIFEAGTADNGSGPQPYFAMELVRGESLLQYAEAHQLSTRERLQVMVRICDAVHHAHQCGIIHRDLKPVNILVAENGQPKILDLGVARVTDNEMHVTRQTDLGQLVGTLAYMSPEQVLADPLALDTRSDVYALGVILFELLAGRMPYKISRQLHEAVRTIREEDPAPLSSISRTYRGDIETIARKALEKDRARRYSSAAELAADIQRYLRDEPITARRPRVTYQLQKFARRNRAVVTGIAAVFVVLVLGIIASTWEARRARLAQQAALGERDRAAAAEQATARERDRALSAERVATRERNRAVAAEANAVQERNHAVSEKQRADNESASAKVVSDFLQNDLLAQASADAQARPETKPDPDLKVRTALDRAAARIDGKFDQQPLVEASIRQTIGNTYQNLGLYPEAERQLLRALSVRTAALGGSHRETLRTMGELAGMYLYEGKYSQAEPMINKVLEVQRRVQGDQHPDTLRTMTGLAALYRNQGKYAQAEPLYTKVLEVSRRMLGEEHPDSLNTMNELALVYQGQGKYAQAEPLFVKFQEACRRKLGEEHPDTLTGMNNLALLYHHQGKYAQAETLYSKVLEVRRRVLGEEHPKTLISMINVAALYFTEEESEKAEPLYSRALEISRRVLGEDHPFTLNTLTHLAELKLYQGKYQEAEASFAKALEVSQRELGEDHPQTLNNVSHLAELYLSQGRYALAEPLFTRVLEGRRRALGEGHPGTADTMASLGELRLAQGRYAEAEPLLRATLTTFAKSTTPDTWRRYDSQIMLGVSVAGQKRYSEAEALLVSGYEGMVRQQASIPAASRSKLQRAGNWIVQLYQDWGKPEKATEWRARLEESLPANHGH